MVRVYNLKPEHFDEYEVWNLIHKKPTLVLFYVPSCAFCKDVKPKLAELEGVRIRKFNCNKYLEFYQKIRDDAPFLITGFPALIAYIDGEPTYSFVSDRTLPKLKQFCKQTGLLK